LARLRGRKTAKPLAWLDANQLSKLLDSPSPPLRRSRAMP